ncbi:MAG: hypothetical protein ACTSVA_02135, partial [Candidatus Njordarchaeales archaeon]
MKKEKVADELSRRIKSEFEPILKLVEELELNFEETMPKFRENMTKEEVEATIDSLDNLAEKYEEFLMNITSIAGEVAGFSKEGEEAFRELEDVRNKLERLREVMIDFSGVLKKAFIEGENNPIQEVKKEYVEQLNKSLDELREFFSDRVYEIIRQLMDELEKIEAYYET